jgi:glutaredoxin
MLAFARLLVLLTFAFGAIGVHAQYKWTDHEGVVSYGDQPAKDAEHVERIGTLAGPADTSSDALARLPFEIRIAAHDFPVVLYARPDCQPCDDARAFLKSRNVPFSERIVNSQSDLDAFHRLGGKSVLPAAHVGRQMLQGFESGAWSEALATAGYPRDVPLPRDWQWAAATPLAPPPAAPAVPAAADGAPTESAQIR